MEQMMIRLSDSAAEVLRESIIASSFGVGKTLRLSENEFGFFLEDDGLGMNDRIVQRKGMPILLIDLRLEERIGEGMIDIDHDSDNAFLSIRLAECKGASDKVSGAQRIRVATQAIVKGVV